MSLTANDLVKELHLAGIVPGDHVLLHSSLSSIGWIEGGADTVVEAMIRAVGDDGTALFPTLSGSVEFTPENPPHFDVTQTSCWTGAIPRASLSREDGARSLHATHSVKAFGRLAEWITAGHEDVRTPCGFGSPYDKLADIGGKILLLGVTQESNTCFHHAEELARVPYVLQSRPADLEMIDRTGKVVEAKGTFLHLYGVERDYCQLEAEMISRGICRLGTVGNAETKLVDALRLREFLVNRLLVDPCAVLPESEKHKF